MPLDRGQHLPHSCENTPKPHCHDLSSNNCSSMWDMHNILLPLTFSLIQMNQIIGTNHSPGRSLATDTLWGLNTELRSANSNAVQTQPIITHHQARASSNLIISEGIFFDRSLCSWNSWRCLSPRSGHHSNPLRQPRRVGKPCRTQPPSSGQADKERITHLPDAILHSLRQSL